MVPLAAKAFFCLEIKEAKIQVNPEGFFARWAFALQNGQNRGWKVLRLASPLLACASVKNSYALPSLGPALFCPFSAEAVGLTEE